MKITDRTNNLSDDFKYYSMLSREEFVRNYIFRDREILLEDFKKEPCYGETEDEFQIIADFTEYSPLHAGHRHCMMRAKKQVPDGLFVAVVPGPFERSGRGLPYIMTRKARADSAVAVGADIVIEGPPMGIMGSGQYSLCLAKIFKAVNADYIPRGYKPVPGFQEILQRISDGRGVAPKPYKIVDMDTGEVLISGKLHEDNYVIVSLSKSLKKVSFDFKGKFIFVKRIEGVSGTKIREAVLNNDFKSVCSMLPPQTIEILNREIEADRAPLHRDEKGIIERANHGTLEYLRSLVDDRTSESIIKGRPFKNIAQVERCILQGFSRHFKNRILSSLEAGIKKEALSGYIDKYPSVIRILNYKDKETLKNFENSIPHRRIELWQ
ncbi:MAG: nucleotidyltransferase family protein [Methanobacteriaceae archaeon]